jgi:hypothetical protein
MFKNAYKFVCNNLNPFSAIGDFGHHIVVNFTYVGSEKGNPSFDILGEMQ